MMRTWTRWVAFVSVLGLVAATLLGAGSLELGDPRSRLAQSVTQHSNGRISLTSLTAAGRGTAYSTFPRSYARARVSFRVGGVLVGRDPDGWDAVSSTPLSIPKFDYTIHRELNPVQVDLRFETRDGKAWSVRVPAGVIHPATAVAVEGGVVLYTLTGSVEEERLARANAAEPAAGRQPHEEASKDMVLNPMLEKHRVAWLPALADLYADNRTDRDVAREVQGLELLVHGVTAVLGAYEDLTRTPPKEKGAEEAAGADEQPVASEEAMNRLEMGLLAYAAGLDAMGNDAARAKKLLLSATSGVADPDAVARVHSMLAPVTRRLVDDDKDNDKVALIMLAAGFSRAVDKRLWGDDPLKFDGGLLSIVEERSWQLEPSGFTIADKQIEGMDAAPFQFVHRFAIQDPKVIDTLDPNEIAALQPVDAVRQHVEASLNRTLLPNDWALLDQFGRFLIVQRVVRCVVEGEIADFPVETWERLLADMASIDQTNHSPFTTDQLFERTRRWHNASVLHSEDSEMVAAPSIPDGWRIR